MKSNFVLLFSDSRCALYAQKNMLVYNIYIS